MPYHLQLKLPLIHRQHHTFYVRRSLELFINIFLKYCLKCWSLSNCVLVSLLHIKMLMYSASPDVRWLLCCSVQPLHNNGSPVILLLFFFFSGAIRFSVCHVSNGQLWSRCFWVSLITMSQRLCGVKGQQAWLMTKRFGQLTYCLSERSFTLSMHQQL